MRRVELKTALLRQSPQDKRFWIHDPTFFACTETWNSVLLFSNLFIGCFTRTDTDSCWFFFRPWIARFQKHCAQTRTATAMFPAQKSKAQTESFWPQFVDIKFSRRRSPWSRFYLSFRLNSNHHYATAALLLMHSVYRMNPPLFILIR